MRTSRPFAALTLVVALLSAQCAGFPGLTAPAPAAPTAAQSLVGQVAIYGRQFVVAGDGALTGLDFVIGAGIIDRGIGVSILQVMKRTGDEAVRLAAVLRIIDQTRNGLERASALQKAQAIVAGIGALFDDGVLSIQDPRTRTIVAAILQTMKALIGDFSRTLVSGTPVAYAAEADAFDAFALHIAAHAALSQ